MWKYKFKRYEMQALIWIFDTFVELNTIYKSNINIKNFTTFLFD